MTIVIWLYLIICIALVGFDLVFFFLYRRRGLAAYQINEAFAAEIADALEKRRACGQFPQGFAVRLGNRLSAVRNMITLERAMEADAESKKWFQPYIWAQMQQYAQKSDAEQAYYAYLLSIFDYSQKKPQAAELEGLLHFLESKFYYTIANTMLALSAIGDGKALLWAVQKIEESPVFYHKKLLLDGLLEARMADADFDNTLQEHFAAYAPDTQDCLLHYFRRTGTDAAALCLRLLESESGEKQLRYTALRYFVAHPCAQVRQKCLDLLTEETADWLEQMLAIRVLQAEGATEGVRIQMQEKLANPCWYARMNGTKCMEQSGLSWAEIADILCLYDRCANVSLLCRCQKEQAGYVIGKMELPEGAAWAEAAELSENAAAISG